MNQKLRRLNVWACALSLVVSACNSAPVKVVADRTNEAQSLAKPYVVLVSLDGFRSDYVDTYSPPFLQEMRKEGASAKNLIPVYPSKTFTNHLSIITGLYAEHHGIVANSFYDPARHESYSLADRAKVQDPSWYSGEPLWVTAEKQGMLAATYFWPGSEAPIAGQRPTYYYEFNKTTEPGLQVKQVVDWLSLPEAKRPHFIALYLHHVDTAGHRFGPNSVEVKDAVLKVDQALGDLNRQLKTLNLPVNLVVVSDHGMQELDRTKVLYVEDYTQFGKAKLMGDGPLMMVYSDDASELKRIDDDLKKVKNHFKVYQRKHLPPQYHLAGTARAGDLVLIPEAPYALATNRQHVSADVGAHGYDPDTTQTMRAIFFASGPQIKKHFHLKPFRNVHIYPFLAKLLGLKVTAPVDGDVKVLSPALH